MFDVSTLNAMPSADFVQALDGVMDRAPWVAEAAAAGRPFASAAAVHGGLMAALRAAPEERRIAFLNGHPDLSADALAADLTDATRREHGGSELSSVTGEEALATMLRDYRDRHGIPFIIASRRHTPESVVRALSRRLGRDPAQEHETAMREVGHVSRVRLFDRLTDAAAKPGSIRLTLRSDAEASKRLARVILLREGREVWAGEARMSGTTTLLDGTELRIGHYALGVEGWPKESPALGGALRFAVRDPEARLTLQARMSAESFLIRVIGPA